MAYNPINFQNTEAGGTPLSASNLNHLEQGIIVANELVPESDGSTGQVLTKTENGTAWQNTQESLPSGGTVGQVLTKTETGSAWQDTDAFPEEGTVGQVLTKSATGVQWTNAGNPTDTQVAEAVTDWLDENVTTIPQTAPIVDTSLTIQGAAADAKKTGEEISDLKSQIAQSTGMSAEFKVALENLVNQVVFKGDDPTGRTYINALHTAMYPPANLTSISTVYTQGSTVVYDTDSLDDLRADLVVTAFYDNSTSEIVTAYTLSGTLTVGTSTVTVSYGGKTATFDVVVSQYEEPWDYEWSANLGTLPQGMTATSYDFTTEEGAMKAICPNLDFNHEGDGEIEIVCKWIAGNTQNNPSIALKRLVNAGCKIYGNASGDKIMSNISGSNVATAFSDESYHTIKLKGVGTSYTMNIDDTETTGNGVTNNTYLGNTGINCTNNAIVGLFIKSIKYRTL